MILQGRSFSGLERHCSFLNTGGQTEQAERFATISYASGLDFPDDGRALSVVDWDQDGDLDLWLSARNAPRVRLMLNDNDNDNNFVSLQLKGNGTTSNLDAIGSRIQLFFASDTDSSLKHIKTLRAGEGFLSQDSKTIHFGLGNESVIEKIVVHWPDGQEETFTNIVPNKSYQITQGKQNAIALSPRNLDSLQLKITEQTVAKADGTFRIPLQTRMPLGKLPIRNYAGKPQILTAGTGGPVLVTLWASWCPSCKEELTSFTEHAAKIKENNIGIVALSVDGLGDERSDLNVGKELLNSLQFPFPVGFATQQLVTKLQDIHDLLIPLQQPLPIPASFLIDPKGQISIIYKGKVDIDTLLHDSRLISEKEELSLQDTSPFTGRLLNSLEMDSVVQQNQARIYFKRGSKLIDQQEYDEALTYFNKVLQLQPDSYKTHYNIAIILSKLNDPDQALSHIQKALQLQPDNAYSHKVAGSLLLKKGNIEKATYHFDTFLDAHPNDPEALNTSAIILSMKKDYKGAEKQFEKAITANPLFIQAHFNLAQIYLNQNKFSEAEKAFSTILTINPNYPEVMYNLGFLAELSGQSQRAINLYSGELKNNPVSYQTLTAMGRIMEKKGALDYAQEYYTQAIALNNQYQPALQGLKRIAE